MLQFADIRMKNGFATLHVEVSGDGRKDIWEHIYGGDLPFSVRDASDLAMKENPKIEMSKTWPMIPKCFEPIMNLIQPEQVRKKQPAATKK